LDLPDNEEWEEKEVVVKVTKENIQQLLSKINEIISPKDS